MDQDRREGDDRRIDFDQRAQLTTPSGVETEVVLTNVSRRGFRFEHSGAPLAVGDLVSVTTARGVQATGEIRWATERQAGGLFIQTPEDPA